MDPVNVNKIGDGFDLAALMSKLALFFQTYWFPITVIVVGSGLVSLVKSSSIYAQIRRNLAENIFHNWRLVLLFITGIVLSLASGWTTFDGMRNFTHEPILSLMITFGIQGVMLIAAWLIGESFATGMNQRAPDGTNTRSATEVVLGTVIGVLLFIAVASWSLRFITVRETVEGVQAGINWGVVANSALILVIAMLALASLLVNRKSDVVTPYLQGTRVIAKNAVLWMMFLACMGTSVFFSFDSLFSNIFPRSERERAASIRTTNQVAAIVADIGTLTARRRVAASEKLFAKPEWIAYETRLTKLADLAKTAPELIRAQIQRELEEQNRVVKALQEKRANATSAQAGLSARKTRLSEEISRLNALRPGLANDTLEPKTKVAEIQRELDEQRAKTLAEERGVEGSLKVGRGPLYRASKERERLIKSKLEVAQKRLEDAETRLRDIDKKIASHKAELARIDGDLAKLKGEAETAEQLIKVTQARTGGKDNSSFDPATGLARLEQARQTFHQQPTQAALAQIQNSCNTIHSAMLRVEQLKTRAAALSCDPGSANEAAALVFALNTGIEAFEKNCAGGSRLPQTKGTSAMLAFGRSCLQDSGLPSADTAALGAKLSAIELARDDKAHRFVVTWNAFQDGNSLAYLALAIAIAIDALVFMSGLFGANVVRSPLSDVPSSVARTARQLEAIIDSALTPDRFETATLVLSAMHPMTPRDGFTAEVILEGHNIQHDDRVRKVLNAGATIGAVRQEGANRYEIRSELFEYLAVVAKREFDSNKDHGRLSELEKIIAVALLPEVGTNAELVLGHMHPIDEKNGFTSEIFLNEIDPLHVRPVRNVLNAGSTLQVVQRDKKESSRYYIHADLYRVLASIRARALFQPGHTKGTGLPPPATQSAIEGGSINASDREAHLTGVHLPAAASAPAQITQQAPEQQQAAIDRSDPDGLRTSANLTQKIRDAQAEQASEHGHDKSGEPDPLSWAAAQSPDDPAVTSEIRNLLTRPLGLEPGMYENVLATGILEQAEQTASALQGLKQRAPDVWRYFDFERNDMLESLEEARERLLSSTLITPALSRMINQVAEEIAGLIDSLMLMPGGSYERILDDLIQKIEIPAGEGRLDNHGRIIHERLKRHRQAIKKLARKSSADWQQVVQLIRHYDENVPPIQPPSGEQRPN